MDDSTPGNITAGSARRLKRVCEKVEGGGGSPPPNRKAPACNPGTLRAKCSVEIEEGDFDDLGTGKAKLWHHSSASGWYEGDEVDVFNQYGGGPIAVGSGLFLAWCSGFYFVTHAPCEAP